MTPEQIGLLGFVVLVVLLLLRVPVGIAMIAVATAGVALILRPSAAIIRMGLDPYATAGTYSLSVIPLFVLMGMFLSQAGFGKDLYRLAAAVLGRFRGGMAMATVGASALFSAVNGSAVATTSTIATVAIPEMRRYGYSEGLAAGCTAVGGTLGILIPPSGILVLYAILTEESIGRVLIGGIVPGVLTALLLMVTAHLIARFRPDDAPIVRDTQRGEFWSALARTWPVPVIFGATMFGIYRGVFTPTEAGAVGAVACLIVGVLSGGLDWRKFVAAIHESVSISAIIFLIAIGGKMFGHFLSLSRIPMGLTKWIADLGAPPVVVVAAIFAIYFVLGMFMDEIAILVVMTPIMYPVVTSLGYDGTWFGVVTIMIFLSGLLTPPVGMVSFVVASVSKIPLSTVFRSVTPFWVTLLVAVSLAIAFPRIVLFLPSLMR